MKLIEEYHEKSYHYQKKKENRNNYIMTKYDSTIIYIFNLNKNFIPPFWFSVVSVLRSQEYKYPLIFIFLFCIVTKIN